MYDFKSYEKATTIDDALSQLQANPKTRIIAGGTDILIRLREGKKDFEHLVDIHDVEELKKINIKNDGAIEIGSGATFTQIVESKIIQDHVPLLAVAVDSIGGPQIRNMATIGGNICNGVPSADSASSLFAFNAELIIRGENSKRVVNIANFYLGPGKVDLAQNEILTSFVITPDNYEGYYGHFIKYAMRNAMDIATIGCAALLKMENDTIKNLRLSYGVAGPVPLRCKKTEKMVKGRKVDQKLLNKIKRCVLDDVNPRTSWRASKEFRLHIIKELSERVIVTAIERAGGKIH